MRNLNWTMALLLSIFASIALAACSSKPIDELSMARKAMEGALSKEATEYAPDDWARAQMDWQLANSLIQMGRYSEARQTLIRAIGYYNTAKDKSERRVESLKIEINNLKSVLAKDQEAVQKACDNPRTKATIKNRIDAELPLIDERIADMNLALDDKAYLTARRYGQQAVRWIENLEKKMGIV